MSPDTSMPLAPWLNTDGNPLSITPLPGLRSDVIQGLECTYPGMLTARMKELLGRSCGLAGTELGSIDFTGCWFLEEPYSVFRPALTLAIDNAERRWIAEVGNNELPGPVWCVYPKPQVAVYASDNLAVFLDELRERTYHGNMGSWLGQLTAQARTVWSRRHAALRPHELYRADRSIRGWLQTLPSHAFVYDLRAESDARGWPLDVAGHTSRHYRCGRELVFAVAALPTQGWHSRQPRERITSGPEMHVPAESGFAVGAAHRRRAAQGLPAREWRPCA